MHQTSPPGLIRPLFAVAVCLLTCAASLDAGQDSKSAAAARELAQLLDTAKLDAIAVADPGAPGTFIAAISIPETQLLVVSAQYAAPSLLADKIAAGDFRGVYMDLHAAGNPASRIFVQDMGPDGLSVKDDNGDSWEAGGKTTTFDGEWKKSKLSEAQYGKAVADADERYAQMLGLLLAQIKQVKQGGS